MANAAHSAFSCPFTAINTKLLSKHLKKWLAAVPPPGRRSEAFTLPSIGDRPLVACFAASLLCHFLLLWLPPGPSLIKPQVSQPIPIQGHIGEASSRLSVPTPSLFSTPAEPSPPAVEPTPPHALSTEPAPQLPENPEETGIYNPPHFENEFTPYYPLHLLAKGTRGSVSVEFSIGADGAPTDVVIVGGTNEEAFHVATLSALEFSRFTSGSHHRGMRYVLTVTFDPQGLAPFSTFDKPN